MCVLFCWKRTKYYVYSSVKWVAPTVTEDGDDGGERRARDGRRVTRVKELSLLSSLSYISLAPHVDCHCLHEYCVVFIWYTLRFPKPIIIVGTCGKFWPCM